MKQTEFWERRVDLNYNERWEAGDLVQLDPVKCSNRMLAGMVMVVTELRDWGVIGYVQMPGQRGEPGGQAYYRARFEECHWVGKAMWMSGGEQPPEGFVSMHEEEGA